VNKLIERAMPWENPIRWAYKAEIQKMTKADSTRDENAWNFFCDQDQLYYLAYLVVPELEQFHDENLDEHNQFTTWLNALFDIEAAVLDFDRSV
jgi:hypothetical protein